jgi:tRNA-dihydrouridine synthase B
MLKIGKIKIKNNLVLAPMVGVNCSAFRLLCKDYGVGLLTTPMFHCNEIIGLYNKNKEKFEKLLGITKKERPISIQIVGSEPEALKQATLIINKYADIIDFNLGCPDKNILANKAGAYFAKNPEKISFALKPIIENSKKPVTAKVRLGWDNRHITLFEQIKILEDLGVNAVAVHGRTVAQGFSGNADWNYIKKAKERSILPIIGNGDINSAEIAKKRLEETNVDGLMVGRSSLGNPFIFDQINHLIKTGKVKELPTIEQKKKAFTKFYNYFLKNKEQCTMADFKNHAIWFTKSIPGARKIRSEITQTNDFDKIKNLILGL